MYITRQTCQALSGVTPPSTSIQGSAPIASHISRSFRILPTCKHRHARSFEGFLIGIQARCMTAMGWQVGPRVQHMCKKSRRHGQRSMTDDKKVVCKILSELTW